MGKQHHNVANERKMARESGSEPSVRFFARLRRLQGRQLHQKPTTHWPTELHHSLVGAELVNGVLLGAAYGRFETGFCADIEKQLTELSRP